MTELLWGAPSDAMRMPCTMHNAANRLAARPLSSPGGTKPLAHRQLKGLSSHIDKS